MNRTILPLQLRTFAAVVLVTFFAAQTLCFIHCKLGGHAQVTVSCHSQTAAQACHDNDRSSSPPAPARTATCPTLKNILAHDGELTQFTSNFLLLYTLHPFSVPPLEIAAAEPTAGVSRPTQDVRWVFRPEVCLGPAFRSLAPPFLA